MWFAMPNLRGEPGFSVTNRPGFLEWNADSKLLTAIQGTDMCSRVVGRTVYQFGHDPSFWRSGPSWLLTKMEINVQPTCLDTDGWKPYWEAAPLPELPKVR